ncbi:MAG: hypothetical protein Q8R01_00565 [Ramlibacter sp.]|nr:hypothetical protein [Ramlibacter sp.]
MANIPVAPGWSCWRHARESRKHMPRKVLFALTVAAALAAAATVTAGLPVTSF